MSNPSTSPPTWSSSSAKKPPSPPRSSTSDGVASALPPHGRMVGLQTTFLKQFFDIAQGKRVAKIPPNRADNQLRFGLPPLEDRRPGCHSGLFKLPVTLSLKLATQPARFPPRALLRQLPRRQPKLQPNALGGIVEEETAVPNITPHGCDAAVPGLVHDGAFAFPGRRGRGG